MANFSETRTEIFKALANFRTIVKQPTKDASNPYFGSKYVILEGVVKAIDEAIDGLGLAYFQEATSDGNQVSVKTYIIHESGEYIEFEDLNVPVSKNDAQAFGSALTYAKRYTLASAFGITSDVDDDGNSATQGATKDKPQVKKASAKQVGLMRRKVKEYCQTKGGEESLLVGHLTNKFGIKDIYDVSPTQASTIIQYISDQLEKNNQPKQNNLAWEK